MKAYLITTGSLFALLAGVHIWRMFVEGSVMRNPWFLAITLIAAALCFWAVRLLRTPNRAR